jgi:hypothetical protein
MLFGETWLIFLEKKNYDFKNGVCRRMRRNQIKGYLILISKAALYSYKLKKEIISNL